MLRPIAKALTVAFPNNVDRIEIAFNVNHTVDTTENGDADLGADFEQDSRGNTTEQSGDLQSKPSFEVNMIRGDTTLSLTCRFMDDPVPEGTFGKCSMAAVSIKRILK